MPGIHESIGLLNNFLLKYNKETKSKNFKKIVRQLQIQDYLEYQDRLGCWKNHYILKQGINNHNVNLNIVCIKLQRLKIIEMKSLFIKSLTKLITQLKLKGNTNAQFLKFSQKLTGNLGTQFKIKHLSRLADSPVRALLKIPCPVDSFDSTKIQAFKRLRNSYGIKQQTVCLKCPKINKCPFRYAQPQQKTQAKLQHLLYFLVSLEKCKQQEYSDLRWSSAYKVSQNLRIMCRNPQNLKQQSQVYQQINRNQQSKQLEYKQKKDRKKSPTKILQSQRVYRLNKSTPSS